MDHIMYLLMILCYERLKDNFFVSDYQKGYNNENIFGSFKYNLMPF